MAWFVILFINYVKIHSRRCRKGQTQRNNKSTQIELVTQPLHGDEASIDIQPESSENFGTGTNGMKMSWESFQKIRKLLNFQKAGRNFSSNGKRR